MDQLLLVLSLLLVIGLLIGLFISGITLIISLYSVFIYQTSVRAGEEPYDKQHEKDLLKGARKSLVYVLIFGFPTALIYMYLM